jgi:hypothetical protein
MFTNWNNQNYNYQPSTNIVYVTGPDEAVMRATNRGADEVFFDQSKPVFYRVKVDYDGRKSWAQFSYNADNVTPVNNSVSREDFEALAKKVEELKAMITKTEE